MSLNLTAIFGTEVTQIDTPSIPILPESPFVETEVPATEPSERPATDTLSKFPDEIDESESPTLRGLCSPNPADSRLTVGDRQPVANGCLSARCDHCGSADYLDVDIHSGLSVRRDCAQCYRTLGFAKWYASDNDDTLTDYIPCDF
jgi:hypothetical protein